MGSKEKRERELEKIWEFLDKENEIQYIEGSFRHYIDNKIDDNELDRTLKRRNEILPAEFFDMPIREKKKYFTHTATVVDVLDDTFGYRTDQIFNRNYFYRLAIASKKNKEITAMLVDYVAEIGFDWNILFLCMQYIKLSQIKQAYLTTDIKNYRKEKGNVYTVFDLVVSAFSEWDMKKNINTVRTDVFKLLRRDAFLRVDVDHTYFQFILCMECLLNVLPKKEANTLKVKFLILGPEHLRDDDYYADDVHQRRILKNCRDKMCRKNEKNKSPIEFNRVKKFIKDNKQWYDNMGPNGYFALYQFLIGE